MDSRAPSHVGINPPPPGPGGSFAIERQGSDFTLLECNDVFEVHCGLEAGTGRAPSDLKEALPGEIGRDFQRCCQEALAKGEPLCRRLAIGAEEAERCILIALSPQAGAETAPARINGVSVDITALARAEASMSAADGFDRYLIHATDRFSEPVLICDATTSGPVVVFANKAFNRIFGYTRSEIVGRDPVYLLFPEQVQAIHEVIESASVNQRPVWRIANAVQKDGATRRCKTVFEFRRVERHAQAQIKVTFITLDNEAAAVPEAGPGQYRRLQLQGMLQAAGSIINDFNNLLAVIIGNAPLLPAQVQDNIESIKTSKSFATQAADIVVNLLRATRRLRPIEPPPAAPPPPPPPAPDAEAPSALERAIRNPPPLDTARAARELASPGPAVPAEAAAVFSGPKTTARTTSRRAPAPSAAPEPQGESPRILIVDDEPFIRSMIDRSLSLVGYRTTQCGSGEEALALFDKNRAGFDAVIMDYTLGGVSGLEVLQIMRRHSVDIPVLMISGYLGPQVTEQTMSQGRVRVLTKPFHPNELLETIEAMVRGTD